MTTLGRSAVVLLGATLLLAGPLAADWLVLTDGTRLQTRGAWEERGRLVVFTTTDGTLASMSLDEIDLEASQRATEEAAKPPPPPARPAREPRQAVFVLTDADVAHRPDSVGEGGGGEEEATPSGDDRLVVTDWQESPLPDESGTLITGTLRNVSNDATTSIRLTVLVYDASGDLLATDNAMVSSQALMPGQQARFQVEFSGIYTVAAVSFRPSTLALDVGSPPVPPEAAEPGLGEPPAEEAAEETGEESAEEAGESAG